MSFSELNSVEHYIIHQLSGVNLNTAADKVAEDSPVHGVQWVYKSPEELSRGINEVLLEGELQAALIRLNPEIAARPELADEVIHELRAILISVNHSGLVKANEEFFQWMTGEKTFRTWCC
jgi:type I restriction enzyme R subunit